MPNPSGIHRILRIAVSTVTSTKIPTARMAIPPAKCSHLYADGVALTTKCHSSAITTDNATKSRIEFLCETVFQGIIIATKTLNSVRVTSMIG